MVLRDLSGRAKQKRPTGITVFALLLLFYGIFLWPFYSYIVLFRLHAMDQFSIWLTLFFIVLGALVPSATSFYFAYGFWKGWGWILTLSILGCVLGIVLVPLEMYLEESSEALLAKGLLVNQPLLTIILAVLSVLLSLYLLRYFFKAHVKAWFGKE